MFKYFIILIIFILSGCAVYNSTDDSVDNVQVVKNTKQLIIVQKDKKSGKYAIKSTVDTLYLTDDETKHIYPYESFTYDGIDYVLFLHGNKDGKIFEQTLYVSDGKNKSVIYSLTNNRRKIYHHINNGKVEFFQHIPQTNTRLFWRVLNLNSVYRCIQDEKTFAFQQEEKSIKKNESQKNIHKKLKSNNINQVDFKKTKSIKSHPKNNSKSNSKNNYSDNILKSKYNYIEHQTSKSEKITINLDD